MDVPKVISIYPEDIRVRMELYVSDLAKLKNGLESATLKSSTIEEKEASDYVINIFYPFLEELLRESTNDT